MSEDEIVQRVRGSLEQEKKYLQNQLIGMALSARYVSQRQLADVTHRVKFIIKSLHPQGAELVDQWVDEVLEPMPNAPNSYRIRPEARKPGP